MYQKDKDPEKKAPQGEPHLNDLEPKEEPCLTCAADSDTEKIVSETTDDMKTEVEDIISETTDDMTSEQQDGAVDDLDERPKLTSVADELMAELQADKEAAAQAAAEMVVTTKEKKLTDSQKELDVMGSTEQQEKTKKNKKSWIIGLSVGLTAVAVIAVCAVLFIGIGLSQAKKDDLYANGTYLDGISIYSIPVGGKTKAQARDAVSKAMAADEGKTIVTLKVQDREIPVTTKDLESENTLEAVLNEAMLFGREGSIVQKNSQAKEAAEHGKNFTVDMSTNEETLEVLSAKIVQQYSIPMKEADVTINKDGAVGEKFVYTEEKKGVLIDQADLKTKLKTFVENKDANAVLEVAYTEELPTTKLADLKQNMVQISSFTTQVGGVPGRKKNVAKAASIMNGTKVMPGETYDLEGSLGPRNAANGWNVAHEIVDNEFVDGYGGGICQASTTLFNAVLMADLEIVDRSNHSLKISYVPVGFDAAISSGGPKFIFRNNTDYPVFIFASSNGSLSELTVEIYGRPLPWGKTTYKRDSVASGGGYKSTLTFLDEQGNVKKSTSWMSRYGTPKVKTQPTSAPATTAAPTPTTATPTTAIPTTAAPVTVVP